MYIDIIMIMFPINDDHHNDDDDQSEKNFSNFFSHSFGYKSYLTIDFFIIFFLVVIQTIKHFVNIIITSCYMLTFDPKKNK